MNATQPFTATLEENSEDESYPFICSEEYLRGAYVYYGIFIPITCFGLPGNILVLMVYKSKLTSSTKIYMFAVAVTDTVILISFIIRGVLNIILYNTRSYLVCNIALVPFFILALALVYTCCILSYVAVERCLAVVRSNTFRLEARRGKRLCAVAAVHCTVQSGVYLIYAWNDENRSDLIRALIVTVYMIPTLAIVVSYTITICFLKKRRNKVGIIKQIRCQANGEALSKMTPTESSFGQTNGEALSKMTPAESSIGQTNDEARKCNDVTKLHDGNKKQNTIMSPSVVPVSQNIPLAESRRRSFDRVTYMLVLVTVMFLLLWIPACVSVLGLNIPDYLRDVYMFNSVINPFIYSFMSTDFRQHVKEFTRRIGKRTT